MRLNWSMSTGKSLMSRVRSMLRFFFRMLAITVTSRFAEGVQAIFSLGMPLPSAWPASARSLRAASRSKLWFEVLPMSGS